MAKFKRKGKRKILHPETEMNHNSKYKGNSELTSQKPHKDFDCIYNASEY